MSAHELRLQLADLIRTAQTIQVAIDEGRCPCVADARILRGQAQCAEHLVEIAYVAGLREVAERTPAEDKAAQRYIPRTDQIEAAVPGLIDDSEPVFSATRDSRRSA